MVRKTLRRDMDEAIRSAVEDVSVDRIKNWCRHIRTRQVLVSLLGQMMNLPIGPKEVSCTHVDGAWQGMTYRGAAELFIGTNCLTCEFHELVAADNIGQEIVARARAQEPPADTADVARDEMRKLVVEGLDVEAVLAGDVESDEHAKTLVGLLGDETRKVDAAAKLLEVARHYPQLISPQLAKIMTGAFTDAKIGASVMLAVALLAKHYPDELWPCAIDAARSAMSGSRNVDEAAGILDAGLAAGRIEPDVDLALLLVSHLDPLVDTLADRIGGATRRCPLVGQAYVRLARISYEAAAQAAGRMLASEEPWLRARGAGAVKHLLEVAPNQACVEFVDPLVAGLAMIDEDGDADPSLMAALAACLGACPQAVSGRIFEKLPSLDADVGSAVLRSFTFDEAVADKETVWAGDFISLLTDNRLDQELRVDISNDIEDLAHRHPTALWPHFEVMLGVLAQVGAEVDAVRSGRPRDDDIVTSQQFWEYEARLTSTYGIARRMNEAVAWVALSHPDQAVRDIDSLLRRTDSKVGASLKAGLILSLGKMGQYDKTSAPSIVPIVYPHLVDPVSPHVRAAAAEACAELVTWNRDILPEDVLVVVAGLLRDEYLQPVVGRAVRVFERARIADIGLAWYVLRSLAILFHLYGDEPTHTDLMRPISWSIGNLARQHEQLVPIAATVLREMCRSTYFYTAKDVVHEFGRFVRAHTEYQDHYVDSLMDYYARFRLLIRLQGSQYMDGQDDDAFENLYQLEPTVVRSNSGKLMQFARESGSDRNLRHVAALLVTLGLNAEAAEMFEALADALPHEPRVDWQRHKYRGLASALKAEVALARDRISDAASHLKEASEFVAEGRAPKRKLPFGLGEADEDTQFYEEWFDLRQQWLGMPIEANGLERVAESLADQVQALDRYRLSERELQIVALASDILRAAFFVGRWWKQVLAGDPTSNAARDAAIAHLAEAVKNATVLGNGDLLGRLTSVRDQIPALGPTSGIEAVVESVRSLPLPFPRHGLPVPREWRGRQPRAEPAEAAETSEAVRPVVAVARVLIDGHEAPDIVTLVAKRLYDIEVEIHLANAPEEAIALDLRPVSSLREDDYLFPHQTIPLEPARATYQLAGQMMFSYPQSEGSAPVSVKLLADFASGETERIPVELFSQRELRIRVCESVERFRARGPAAQLAVKRLQSGIEQLVPRDEDPNRGDELEVAAALANYMDFQLQQASFRGRESEGDFEKSLMQYMRIRFEGRDDIYQQVYSGGGRIDGLILGVPVELKVIKEGELESFVQASAPQATQYVVTQGRRLGFLVILDLRQRDTPTPPIVDDVSVMQGVTEPGLAPVPEGVIALSVAIVRACVARPSDLKLPKPPPVESSP